MSNNLDKMALLKEMDKIGKVMRKDWGNNFTQTQLMELEYWKWRIEKGEFDACQKRKKQ